MNFKEQIKDINVIDKIAKAASQLNIESFIVGGYVRDLILNRTSNDIDIVCLGSGIDLASKVAELLKIEAENLIVFKNFGTAMLNCEGWVLEFVGARKESYRSDSRKPIVENGSMADDQNRRDFTINAMSISLNQVNFGELIDPFDGLLDLENKCIKTLA